MSKKNNLINNNMVESKKNLEEESGISEFTSRLTLPKITAENIEFEISQKEKFTKSWLSFDEDSKEEIYIEKLRKRN